MTPKEKAIELCNKFMPHVRWKMGQDDVKARAKSCALIVVDEIIESRKDDGNFNDSLASVSSEYYTPHPMYLTYWLQVKKEIEQI